MEELKQKMILLKTEIIDLKEIKKSARPKDARAGQFCEILYLLICEQRRKRLEGLGAGAGFVHELSSIDS